MTLASVLLKVVSGSFESFDFGAWSTGTGHRQLAVNYVAAPILRLCDANVWMYQGGTMLIQRYSVILTTAFLFGCAAMAPASSSDADRQLSDALEQALPSLVSSEDYWSASRLYFQVAAARSRLKETAAACTALSQSLAYYLKALVKDTGGPLDKAATGGSNDEGLAEIRTKFGCASTWPALSDGSAGSIEQALPSLVSSGDYRSASQLYFQLATARDRLKESAAACTALYKSLAYYRRALAKAANAPLHEVASDGGNDDGMQEFRSKFGCTHAQFS